MPTIPDTVHDLLLAAGDDPHELRVVLHPEICEGITTIPRRPESGEKTTHYFCMEAMNKGCPVDFSIFLDNKEIVGDTRLFELPYKMRVYPGDRINFTLHITWA